MLRHVSRGSLVDLSPMRSFLVSILCLSWCYYVLSRVVLGVRRVIYGIYCTDTHSSIPPTAVSPSSVRRRRRQRCPRRYSPSSLTIGADRRRLACGSTGSGACISRRAGQLPPAIQHRGAHLARSSSYGYNNSTTR